MRILVTGGAGFIGTHLVYQLSKEKKNKIIIFDNFHRSDINNILKNKNVNLIEGDIRDYKSIKNIGNIDFIYHLAAQSNVLGSFTNPDYTFSSNVIGTYNLLKYATGKKIKKFIFLSSREVYGNPTYLPVDEKHPLGPINMYGSTKAAGEMLCKTFMQQNGLAVTTLRMANVYGLGDKDRVIPIFLDNIRRNKNLTIFGGKQVLDFIWVGDAVNAIIEISNKDKYDEETINIGTGVGTSINDLAKKIIKISNSGVDIIKKKQRVIDVEKFISKSDKFKSKNLNLDDGLKRMIKMHL